MGSSLFGGKKARANTPSVPAPDLGLNFQTSTQGKPRPIGWGRTKFAGNIIDLLDFFPQLVASYSSTPQQTAGKGGKGAPAVQVDYTYYYFATILISLCEGPIEGIYSIDPPFGGQTVFPGSQDQQPWWQMASAHPERALAYRGEAYVAFGPMALGTSPSIPNLKFEVLHGIYGSGPSFPDDANPATVIVDFLTNLQYGVPGWRIDLIDDLSKYQAACQALGLVVSPILTDQVEASQFLTDLMKATNAEPVWSGGRLKIVPYTDVTVEDNGAIYVPDNTPIYDLSVNDFMAVDGSSDGMPLTINRKAAQDLCNRIQLEYLDRANDYIAAIVDFKDEASIVLSRERPSDVRSAHMFALSSAAVTSTVLQMTREKVANTYRFKLPRTFVLLDPMDLVSLPLDDWGLADEPQVVRIKEIEENDDYSLTFTAEDFLGIASAAKYDHQAIDHGVPDYNEDPGNVNAPVLFEPPDQIAGGLFIYAAVSGVKPKVWGGADVYASFDGTNYQRVTQIKGASRHGVLTAALPSVPKALTGLTVDAAHPLAVDMTPSGTELASGSSIDMLALATASWIEGEIVAYQNATLTGPKNYSLSPLLRGGFGSDIVAHPAGSRFVRIDGLVSKISFDQSKIGQTVYLKFQSFNVWGGALQDIENVPAFPYQITGAALTSPLPNVTNLVTNFSDGFLGLFWDEVNDFRSDIRYKIYKGDTFASALVAGDQAHPPFRLDGAGTYWVVAYCTPISGLVVTSELPQSLTVAGTLLVANVLQAKDQQAENWPGIRTGIVVDGAAGSQILRLADGMAEGTYEIPNTDWIDAGSAASCSISVDYKATGAQRGQDVLALPDVLAVQDWLGSVSAKFIDCVLEIATAPDTGQDAYASADIYAQADAYASAVVWSPWVSYQPGVYFGRYFKVRARLTNAKPDEITAYLLALKITVSLPVRTDHYQNQAVSAGGLAIIFTPDKATKPAPFNGGPNNQALPFVQITSAGGLQPGDQVSYSNLTTSGCTINIVDKTGAAVARNGINISVEGY